MAIAGSVLAAVTATPVLAAPTGLLSSFALAKAKGLRLSLPMDGHAPVLLVECGEISLERARMGFLKIGLIPVMSVDNFELTIVEPSDRRAWAENFAKFLGAEAGHPLLLIRHFVLKNNQGAILLAARKAEKRGTKGVLRLESVSITDGPFAGYAREAKLYLSGPDAGYLQLSDRVDKVDPTIRR